MEPTAISASHEQQPEPRTATPTGLRPTPSVVRAGATAALVKAATYVIGLGLVAGYLAPRGYLAALDDPAASLAFLLEHQALLYVWYLVLYLVGGTALVVLALALHEHLRDAAGTLLVRTATAFGLVWAGLLLAAGLLALVGQRAVVALAGDDPEMATATWSSVTVVQDALGGGIEVVGALWVLLVSLIGLRSARWGRGLSGLGLGLGACGVLTLVPPVADAAGAAFGIGFVVWFVWVAVALLRGRS